MQKISPNTYLELVGHSGATPCVSIYLENNSDQGHTNNLRVRLYKYIEHIKSALVMHSVETVNAIINNLLKAIYTIPYSNQYETLAIFANTHKCKTIPLSIKTNDTFFIADSFHIKPLAHLLKSNLNYYVITLGPNSAIIYDANVSGLTLKHALFSQNSWRLFYSHTNNYINTKLNHKPDLKQSAILPNETAAYYSRLNRYLAQYTNNTEIPVIVGGAAHAIAAFQQYVKVPNVIFNNNVTDCCESLDLQILHAKTWEIAAEYEHQKTIQKSTRIFSQNSKQNIIIDRLHEILQLARYGKVKQIFLEKNITIKGYIDKKNGHINIPRQKDVPVVDDILDDLAEMVIMNGGEVNLLESHMMPTASPVVALIK